MNLPKRNAEIPEIPTEYVGGTYDGGLMIIRHQEVFLYFQLLVKYNISYKLKPLENGDYKGPYKRGQIPLNYINYCGERIM